MDGPAMKKPKYEGLRQKITQKTRASKSAVQEAAAPVQPRPVSQNVKIKAEAAKEDAQAHSACATLCGFPRKFRIIRRVDSKGNEIGGTEAIGALL